MICGRGAPKTLQIRVALYPSAAFTIGGDLAIIVGGSAKDEFHKCKSILGSQDVIKYAKGVRRSQNLDFETGVLFDVA
jgi:hypothetical protein